MKNEWLEIRKGISELIESQKKTDEQLKKTDAEIEKTSQELRRLGLKTDAEIEKTSQELRRLGLKTDAEIEKTNKMVANLTDGWGRFTEGLIIPSLEKILVDFGLKVIEVGERMKCRKNGEEMEIDILTIAERDGVRKIIAVEAKTYLRKIDIDDFLSSMAKFSYFFDEYKGKEVIGFVAYMNCEKGVIKYADNQGLYVLGPSDDVMVIKNKKGFKPKNLAYDERI